MQVCTFVDAPSLSVPPKPPLLPNDRIPELRENGWEAACNSLLSSCSIACRGREKKRETGEHRGRRWWCDHQLYHRDMWCDPSRWGGWSGQGGTEKHRIENADKSSRSVSSSKKKRLSCSCIARTSRRSCVLRFILYEEALTQIHRRPLCKTSDTGKFTAVPFFFPRHCVSCPGTRSARVTPISPAAPLCPPSFPASYPPAQQCSLLSGEL